MTEPINSDKVSPEWLACLLDACNNDRQRIRAHPTLPRLQGWSPNFSNWCDLMLPGSGFDFTNAAERDLVLARFKTQ
jgi:hypothetical protein